MHVERSAGRAVSAEPDGTDRPFELELAETGVTLTVPADQTALEIVHQVLPDHPLLLPGRAVRLLRGGTCVMLRRGWITATKC